MKQQPIFITFEGPEGSGKSTLIKKLGEWLEKKKLEYIVTREPGGTDIAEQIRKVILSNENTLIAPRTEALLYAASRAQHVKEVINPAFDEGKIILCDRFLDSSLVYQGVARKIGVDEVYRINDFAINGLLPDITFLLDVDPEIGLKRIEDSDRKKNRMDLETIAFHRDVHDAYKELSRKYRNRYVVIDASESEDEVFKVVTDRIQKSLSK